MPKFKKISKHYKRAAKELNTFESLLMKESLSESDGKEGPLTTLGKLSVKDPELLESNNIGQNLGFNNYLEPNTSAATRSSYCSVSDSDSESSLDCPTVNDSKNINIESNVIDVPMAHFSNVNLDLGSSIPELLSHSLSQWALKHNITHTAINDLLKILKPYDCNLPIDARTLLSTPKNHVLKSIEPGSYYHFGLKNCFKLLLSNFQINSNCNILEILVNIDGLPLSKSSSSQFYPILCSLFGGASVAVIGIYHGHMKPHSANSFLQDFQEEATDLINNGFYYNGVIYMVKIKGFVCDAPAKSFIKYIKGHSGYMSCTKCYIEGSFCNDRVCFPQLFNLKPRTDIEYRSKVQKEHHTGTSIIEYIPGIDMIQSFPLDYMHLVCLGVMKKLINLWLCGKPSTKLQYRHIVSIDQSLTKLSSCIPLEFNRKPRNISDFKRWKATEFRQFLLYTGPVVLKPILSKERYLHFLTLHVAIYILSSFSSNNDMIDYAEKLLHYFLEVFITLYGQEHISHNVHNLLHLTDDVKLLGPLDNFSAFKFENYMQVLKNKLRKHEKPLEQIINRIKEMEVINFKNRNKSVSCPLFEKKHFDGPIFPNQFSESQYKQLTFKNYSLTTSEPNNCCCLNDGTIVLIKNFANINSKSFVFGHRYLTKTPYYEKPCESSEINIFCLGEEIGALEHWDINSISFKFIKVPIERKCIVFPMVHLQ